MYTSPQHKSCTDEGHRARLSRIQKAESIANGSRAWGEVEQPEAGLDSEAVRRRLSIARGREGDNNSELGKDCRYFFVNKRRVYNVIHTRISEICATPDANVRNVWPKGSMSNAP